MAGWDAHAFLLSPAPSARPLTRGLFPRGISVAFIHAWRGFQIAGNCQRRGGVGWQDRWHHGPEACLGRVGQDAPTLVLPCAQDSAHEQGAIEPQGWGALLAKHCFASAERPAASGWAGPRSGVYGVSCQPTPPRHPPGSSCSYCGCRPAAGTTAGAGRQPGSGAEALVVHCHQRGGAGLDGGGVAEGARQHAGEVEARGFALAPAKAAPCALASAAATLRAHQ